MLQPNRDLKKKKPQLVKNWCLNCFHPASASESGALGVHCGERAGAPLLTSDQVSPGSSSHGAQAQLAEVLVTGSWEVTGSRKWDLRIHVRESAPRQRQTEALRCPSLPGSVWLFWATLHGIVF